MRKNFLLVCVFLIGFGNAMICSAQDTANLRKRGVSDSVYVKEIIQLTKDNTVGEDFVQCWGTYPFNKDGSKILFTREVNSNSHDSCELFIMDASGLNKKRLTYFQWEDTHGSISPDGKMVVFQREIIIDTTTKVKKARIMLGILDSMIANPKKYNPINLSIAHGNVAGGDSLNCELKPLFSPDGTRILFRSDVNDGMIYSMNLEGKDTILLSDTCSNVSHHSWSPDGKNVVFQFQNDTNRACVAYSAADGLTKPIMVATPGDTNFCANWPFFSPDGKFISYHLEAYNNYSVFENGIYLYNIATKKDSMILWNDSVYLCAPHSWSPDSRWIVYKKQEHVSGTSERAIHLYNIYTQEDKMLTKDYYDKRPWFSPNGNEILFRSSSSGNERDSNSISDLYLLRLGKDIVKPSVKCQNKTITLLKSSAVYTPVKGDVTIWDNDTSYKVTFTPAVLTSAMDSANVKVVVKDTANNSDSCSCKYTVLKPYLEIKSVSNGSVVIYPNPASDYINIETTATVSIQIINMTGATVLSTVVNGNQSIDISDISSGTYILKISGSDISKTEKIIIE